jgi:L-alanine-DL-glutamate epimerase-like enolase superfamily enzyme
MQITNITVLIHEHAWRHPIVAPTGSEQLGILTIETDEGLSGNSFVSGAAGEAISQIIKLIKPMLIGRNASDIGSIWSDMWARNRILLPMAMGAIDIALWDIMGKAANLPVYQLLGAYKSQVPAYFSSYQHASPSDFAEEALYWKGQGWAGYKLHPPTQRRHMGEAVPVSADVEACKAIRAAVGSDMSLMLDAAFEYSYAEALGVGRAIEELSYSWYEDPLPANDIYGYTRLKQWLQIPIVATEWTEGGLFALPSWILARATDALRGDVAIKGGITGMMKIAHLAEAFHLPFEVHDAFNAANNVATLHVIMASATAQWFEVLPFNQAGELGLGNLWYGLSDAPRVDDQGYVHAPEGPGLGLTIDWDRLRAPALATLT